MKALIINQYGGPEVLRLQEAEMPAAGRGEVLVRIHAAGVNPVDFKIRNGSMKFITGKNFPRILGGEIAGIVERAPANSSYRAGDKVYAMLPIKGGGYAEFTSVKESMLCHVPEGLSMYEAASVPLASLTALQAFRKAGGIKKGDNVLINGSSGGVGSFAVQIAKAQGAFVTGVCSTRNTEFVRDLGADTVIDYNSEDFTGSSKRYSMVFDAVAKSSFPKCSRILEDRGTYITTVPNNGLFIYQALNSLRKKRALFIMAKPSGSDLMMVSDYYAGGLLKPYIQEIIDLDDGARAHKIIETERVRGKLVLSVIR